MIKDSNVLLTRILLEDGQRTNLTIQPQYIHVQDASKLKPEIYLSMKEAEYIALSQAMMEIIPMMEHL